MASFKVVDIEEAPPRPKPLSSVHRRMKQYEAYIEQIKPNQVGRLVPGPGESPRALALRVNRAATRLNQPVDSWIFEQAVYFKRIED